VSVSILIIQILNSLFYASVLFLIAAGLSLIFGVMRIVNMAHGTFYAVGAFVTAWLVGRAIALGVPAGWTFLLIPVGAGAVALLGIVIEPLLRPFYRRAEEYQLLVTFGLLLILEDVIRLLWGGLCATSDRLIGGSTSAAARVEIHEMTMKDNVATMRPLTGGLPIEPGKTVTIAPGSYHLMFVDLKSPLKQGDKVTATLEFEKAGKVDVTFAIQAVGAQSPMPGHSEHKM
jgi:branched-subunit amino acid ABC-type transport system permease component